LLFFAADMWGNASEGFVLHAGAEVTMPIIRAVDGRVIWGCLETLIAEYGLLKAWVSVWGVAFVGGCLSWAASRAISGSLACIDREGVGFVWLFGRWGFCEHLLCHRCHNGLDSPRVNTKTSIKITMRKASIYPYVFWEWSDKSNQGRRSTPDFDL
jgi:hypothetical protein